MPPTQDNCRQGSPCTDQQPPFSLLSPFEFEELQLNSQALYPQLISSLYGNSLSEFATPSCIDPRWLHNPSTTVGTYRSATRHLFHPADQKQTLGFSPDISEIPAFTLFDPNEIMPSDLRCSGIDKLDTLVLLNSQLLSPGVPEVKSKNQGESPLNSKYLSSNASRRKSKRRSSMEEPQSTRALKRCRFSSPYSEQNNVKLPYLGNFQCEDMSNRKKVTLVDNSPPLLHQTNRADKGREDEVDTFSQDKPRLRMPKGDAAHAILELSKRDLVVSKEVIDIPMRQRIELRRDCL